MQFCHVRLGGGQGRVGALLFGLGVITAGAGSLLQLAGLLDRFFQLRPLLLLLLPGRHLVATGVGECLGVGLQLDGPLFDLCQGFGQLCQQGIELLLLLCLPLLELMLACLLLLQGALQLHQPVGSTALGGLLLLQLPAAFGQLILQGDCLLFP